ncbi:hypothetical protein BJX68DRAFT_275171 [Aspergillus pseudodeflectus]|uniref:Zn(2)-C6 fungal-type domain-containing protein n=1 Tax=Aspergillus pseudodeflectus TaxID=176178 RepID=A0ABR4KHD5_9EURO
MLSPARRDSTPQGRPRPGAALACEACRKLKMKCIRPAPQSDNNPQCEPCDRCKRTNRLCKIPESRPLGRRPGSLGRYRGLHKAYRKLQEEAKKASPSHGFDNWFQSLATPTSMEMGVQSFLTDEPTGRHPRPRPEVTTPEIEVQSDHPEIPDDCSEPAHETMSNPLALLAYASDAARASEQSPASVNTSASPTSRRQSAAHRLLHRPGYVSLGLQLDRASLVQGLDALFTGVDTGKQSFDYFKRRRVCNRDARPDLDPVELGLVTMEDANYLFPIYFARLHPVNGILDPILHTPEFVRARSSLLFTWILALTAQFDHAAAAMAERLRLHGEKLSRYVHTCGYKSVEIVQGYYISLLSATPAKTLAEERSWLYTMYAIGVATDLGLDQDQGSGPGAHSRISRAHRNYELQSLHSGAEDVPGQAYEGLFTEETVHQERLRRNRERTWLRILLWERANSAACGRIQSFPESSLTRSIETWWLHPLADMTDRYTSAFIILRKKLASLQLELKQQAGVPQSNPHWTLELVDASLQDWCNTWLSKASDYATSAPSPEQVSMIFLYYVYEHGRLWTLSLALSESISRDRDLDAIRQDCFESAVHCCETAVWDLHALGEPLYCMLAPTWAMIAYAAVLTLKLFPTLYGSRTGSDVELIALLSQVALQLQRAGTTPPHRFGIAALLGQHLMMILRTRALDLREPKPSHTGGRVPRHRASEWQSTPSALGQGNPLVSDWDPFRTPAISDQNDVAGGGFDDLFGEIFGPVFGDLP